MIKKFVRTAAAAAAALSICGCSAVTGWIDAQRDRLFPPPAEETTEEQNVIKKPNTINAGIYDFDTFNPLITKSQSVREAMELVYEPLYTLDSEMKPVPVLAEGVEKSADGRTVTLNIKQGITWHDGDPFTATDVAYTFRMIRSGVTSYTQNLANVADYIMTGDYSVQITLAYSSPSFEAMLTFPIVKYQTDMSVNPNYVPNGTGPFCYGTKSRVDEMYFGAFENYRDGRANIDAMYLQMAGTYEKYMSMLEASEIDFSSSDIVNLMEYMPKGRLKLHDYPENRMIFLGFNTANPVLSGALTRQGVSKLIDRGEIVDSVIFSRGKPSKIPINPSSYLYCDENDNFEADELAANGLLGDDGWGPDEDGKFVRSVNGSAQRMSLELLTNSDNSEQTSVADSIAENMNKFGLIVSVKGLPYDQFMQRVSSGNYDMFIGEVELPASMELSQLTSSSGNYFAYRNPELDTITAQMGMTADEAELKALFKQYSDIVVNDAPFAVIYYKTGSLISSSNVTDGIDPVYVWRYKNCPKWRTAS